MYIQNTSPWLCWLQLAGPRLEVSPQLNTDTFILLLCPAYAFLARPAISVRGCHALPEGLSNWDSILTAPDYTPPMRHGPLQTIPPPPPPPSTHTHTDSWQKDQRHVRVSSAGQPEVGRPPPKSGVTQLDSQRRINPIYICIYIYMYNFYWYTDRSQTEYDDQNTINICLSRALDVLSQYPVADDTLGSYTDTPNAITHILSTLYLF